MKRMFITLYCGLIGSLFLMLLLTDLIGKAVYTDVGNTLIAKQLSGYRLLLTEIEHNAPEQVEPLIEQLSAMLQTRVEAIPLARLPDTIREQLLSEKVYANEELRYLIHPNNQTVLAITPDTSQPLWHASNVIDTLLIWSIYLSIAVSAALWLYLLHKKLSALELAAERITQGELSARAPSQSGKQVGTLNQSFNRMADRIEQLITSHKQLTHAVAHELRSPIFRLQCQLEMLDDQQNPDNAPYIQGMADDVQELETLVEELLSYARMERAELKPSWEKHPFAPWLISLCDHLQLEAAQKTLHCRIDKPEDKRPLRLDPRLLERALSNLIRNAIRHAQSRVDILLAVEQSRFCIQIDDDGSGIPAEHHEHIFKPFYRVESARDRNSGGYGLGLAIALEIIKLHQGQIEVSHSPIGGARFTLYLPLL